MPSKGSKLKTYIVRITGYKNKWKVRAYNINGAIAQVWYDIRKGYRYGVVSLNDLRKKAKVKRV